MPCEVEDEWGAEWSFKRHKFVWTAADQRSQETHDAADQLRRRGPGLMLAAPSPTTADTDPNYNQGI